MRSSSFSFASGDETPHAHETWCVRKAANTSAGELSGGSSGTIPLILCGSAQLAQLRERRERRMFTHPPLCVHILLPAPPA